MRKAQTAIPWYVHPAEAPQEWSWLAAQRRKISFAVLNVHDGPGGDNDEYYPAAVAELRPRIQLLGYVRVDYGNRSVADVARDIHSWQRLYGLDGIMLDELPSVPQSLARCAQYAAAARNAGIKFLAANPGRFPTLAHMDLFDVTAVFEGTAQSYAEFAQPAWARDVPPARMWHLVYDCSPGEIAVVRLAAGSHGAGHVFATDRSLPNPWRGTPTAVSEHLVAGHRSARRAAARRDAVRR